MSLDETFQNAIDSVPECVASGCVDMSTGMLLGAQTGKNYSQAKLDVVSAATADLFRGIGVAEIEAMFKKASDNAASSSHYFQEIIVFSEELVHVFLRTRNYPEHVVVFVCRNSANPGIVLAKTRMVLDSVADKLAS